MDNFESKMISKKLSDYSTSHDERNFIAPNEITVTITLEEYRDLVTIKATTDAKVKAAEEDKYERSQRCSRLEQENAELKAELYELKKLLDATSAEAKEAW